MEPFWKLAPPGIFVRSGHVTRPQLVSDRLFLPLPVRLPYGLEIGRLGASAQGLIGQTGSFLHQFWSWEENLRLVFYQIFPFWCMHRQRTPHLCFTMNASPGLCYAMGHQRSSLGAIPEAPTPGPRAYKMVKKHKTRPCSAILACSGACGVASWRSPTRSSITTPLPNQLATIVAIPPSSNPAAWHK